MDYPHTLLGSTIASCWKPPRPGALLIDPILIESMKWRTDRQWPNGVADINLLAGRTSNKFPLYSSLMRQRLCQFKNLRHNIWGRLDSYSSWHEVPGEVLFVLTTRIILCCAALVVVAGRLLVFTVYFVITLLSTSSILLYKVRDSSGLGGAPS